jgi:hypothetical protein
MKRSELKSLIKPLVKESVREVLLEEGLLSGIVAEVTKGMGAPIIREARSPEPPVEKPMFDKKSFQRKKTQLTETKRKLLDAIGKDAYGGIDIFEGTTPAPEQRSPAQVVASPLGDVDSGDPGVDISGIVALGGKNWKALMG